MNEYIECPKCQHTRLAIKGSTQDGGGYRLRLRCQECPRECARYDRSQLAHALD